VNPSSTKANPQFHPHHHQHRFYVVCFDVRTVVVAIDTAVDLLERTA